MFIVVLFIITPNLKLSVCSMGLPWWLRRQRIRLQCRRPWFDSWVGKIPWRRVWRPTPVFLPGESPGTEEPGGLIGSQRVRHDWLTKRSTWHLFFVLCICESVFSLFCWFWILDSTYKWDHIEFTCISLTYWGFPGGSDGKESTCNADDKGDRVWSLGGEDPLEKEMATHSSTLAWKILWTEEPGGLQSIHGVAKSQTWLSDFHFHFSDLFHLV